jgi:phosphatase NudJ
MSERAPFSTHNFAVVVCRNSDGRWLAVKETNNRGWWLPAGLVDSGETFTQAAKRKALQEAGMKVDLRGILRIEHSVYGPTHARMRVVFFAVPLDSQRPKQVPDETSEEARWVTLEDLRNWARVAPGLRGPELMEWGTYVEKGGLIAPIQLLCREDEQIPAPTLQFQRIAGTENMLPAGDYSDLIQAIETGEDVRVQGCLLSGMDVNLPFNEKLWTPLHLACRLTRAQAVFYLLISDAEITQCTHKRRNVLHFAAQSTPQILSMVLIKVSRLVNRLVSHMKRIVNQQDDAGDTPLHFSASMFGRTEMWNLLISAGADPSVRNASGRTAFDVSADL